MKKILGITVLSVSLLLGSLNGYSQFVSIVGNKFVVNGNASCPIYFNGSNNPWESWNDFGGTYNVATWNQDMINLKNNGINTARIWFSCNGLGQPTISTSGVTSTPSVAFWQNCDSLFASAKRNGIYIMATMMSFDHTKNANANSSNWQQMLNSATNVDTYVANYIVPFVNRYKTNPCLWSIDICNEIEWIYENGAGGGDGSNWTGASYPILQRFVAKCAAGIHNNPRTDGTTVLATVGSAGLKWNGAKEIQETSIGPGTSSANSTGNKWSDANLMAQNGSVANGILDFYSPHYYGWMEQYYSSPFENTPAAFGISEKPCVVGEMPAQSPIAPDITGYPTTTMTLTTAFNNLKANGWQGHQPWTANITSNLTQEVGDLATFGSFALAFYNANRTLVIPSCSACTTVAPTVTTPVTYCKNTTASALTATGTGLLWYTASSGGTGSTTAPTPSTSFVGATTYYVSQTISGCEGARASIVLTVNALPTISAGSDVTICKGIATTLTVTGGTSYKWSNSVSTASNGVTPTATTTYSVTGTNTSSCSATSSVIVTINAIPNAPTVTTPVTYYQNTTAIPLTATGTLLKWYTSNSGGTSSSIAPTPITTTVGSTDYFVSQTQNLCESPKAQITVVVNPQQKVLLKAGWNYIGCPISGSTAVSSALSSIWTNVEVIKNLDVFYSTENPVALNTLTNVQWGQGYFVKVSTACYLDWIVR